MSIKLILPESMINDEEYMALYKLFVYGNLEEFFEDIAKDLDENDDPMLDVYLLSDYLNGFVHAFFSGIIKSSLVKEEYPAHLGEIMETWDAWHERVRINCAKLTDKFTPEDKKKQLTERIEEILQITKKIDRQTEHGQAVNDNTLTDLQNHLKENDFVLNDGKTANKSLIDIACEVRKYKNNNEPITWQYLQDNFLKRNGKKFSKGTCENARDFANK